MKRRVVASVPHLVAAAAASVASVALVGCAGSSVTERFYAFNDGGVVLTAPLPAATGAVADSSLPGIVISAVSVPELVDRPQIVTRDGANGVLVAEQNLWAESVRAGIARTLATRLARAMREAGTPVQVAAYPQYSIVDPALRVTIDVVRFDAVPNGEAVIDALYSVRRVSDDTIRSGRTVASAPIAGTSYEAIVNAWNDALKVVDRDVAALVQQVGVPKR